MVGCELAALKLRRVSSDVRVVVTHRDKPISGIAVSVVPEKASESVFRSDTDSLGTVRIRQLTAGRYYVTASHDGFDAGKEWIEVVAAPDAKTARLLTFQWADWSYETSHVAGTLTGLVPGSTGNKLMDIVHPVKTVYPGIEITLKGAFSEAEYRTISDSSGSFLFGDVPDGIYVLSIAGGMKSVTGIADMTTHVIDVNRKTKRDSLPLELKDTGCYRTEFQLIER